MLLRQEAQDEAERAHLHRGVGGPQLGQAVPPLRRQRLGLRPHAVRLGVCLCDALTVFSDALPAPLRGGLHPGVMPRQHRITARVQSEFAYLCSCVHSAVGQQRLAPLEVLGHWQSATSYVSTCAPCQLCVCAPQVILQAQDELIALCLFCFQPLPCFLCGIGLPAGKGG